MGEGGNLAKLALQYLINYPLHAISLFFDKNEGYLSLPFIASYYWDQRDDGTWVKKLSQNCVFFFKSFQLFPFLTANDVILVTTHFLKKNCCSKIFTRQAEFVDFWWDTCELLEYVIYIRLKVNLVFYLEMRLEFITKWLRDSGLIVNTNTMHILPDWVCQINALGEQVGVFIWSSSTITVTKRSISCIS